MTATWTTFAIWTLIVLGAVLTLFLLVHLTVVLLKRRMTAAATLDRTARTPFRLFLVVMALSVIASAVRPLDVPESVWHGLRMALRLAAIGTGAWFVASVVLFVEDLGLSRYTVEQTDNRAARRVRTQGLVIRRLTVAVIVILALGGALFSFPGVRAVGASLLASAGVISVVAGIAAQSTLGNLIAGVQLAFNDAIKLDDVVVVEEEWGRIEEITLSYVVVHLWDDRRLVLPSTYFTTKPFQNWTRRNSELLGGVELDLDWRVDVAALRAHLDVVLAGTQLWDGRVKVLQVTDAVSGMVRVRALVTAVDAPTLFDLRCHVREHIVAWAREHAGSGGLPRQRVELVGPAAGPTRATV